ncbi:GL15161 [Drosophila persimilis]|uniref:GL15161 n=1 Tax=Drosophila persimilis TaxID=7234 RepID=B4H3Q8_DROPE|nr:GL15161 [Drosophila persimilis]
MSKVLSPQKRQTAVRCVGMAMGMSVGTAVAAGGLDEDLEFNSSSSIIDFLAKEQDCGVDADPESIFQEQLRLGGLSTDTVRNRLNAHVSGAADDGGGGDSECNGDAGQGKDRAKSQNQTPSHTPSSSPQSSPHSSIRLNTRFTHRIEHSPPKPGGPVRALPVSSHSRPKSKSSASSTPAQTPHELNGTLDSQSGCEEFAAFVDNLPSESVISEESTPKDMHNTTAALAQLQSQLDNTDDDEDTTPCRTSPISSGFSYRVKLQALGLDK